MGAQTNESNNSTTSVVVNFAPISKYYITSASFIIRNLITSCSRKHSKEKLHIRVGELG